MMKWIQQDGAMPLRHFFLQAKDALEHPYFDDLDKTTINALESDVIRAREQEETA